MSASAYLTQDDDGTNQNLNVKLQLVTPYPKPGNVI